MLWDESFLWGVMAQKALMEGGLSCDLIRSDDVRSGKLRDYTLVFVPGGWASNKVKALGNDGIEEIKQFVHDGGAYIGFCGGAGLATMDGIGLVPVKRRPTKERVPSFSGRIKLNLSSHSLWQGVSEPVFHAWWPSQFVVDGPVDVLATYGEALPDAFTSDINVGDGSSTGSWKELESVYQINLDPKRLIDEPAVIEGTYGKGMVLLSLVHFDTPGDGNGLEVLRNISRLFGCAFSSSSVYNPGVTRRSDSDAAADTGMVEIKKAVDSLIELGRRNFLWFWRNPMLLQWRRGVRGLEYCTLSVMVNEIAALLQQRARLSASPDVGRRIQRVRTLALPFTDKARELLLRERFAMQNEHITYERCQDLAILSLRAELFSRSKSYGGVFKDLLDEIDHLLYQILTWKHDQC